MASYHPLAEQALTEPHHSIYNKVWVENIVPKYGYPQEIIRSYNIGKHWRKLTRIQLAENIVKELHYEHPATSSTYWVALQYLYKHMPSSILLNREKRCQIREYSAHGYYRAGLYNEDFTLHKVLFGN